MRRLLFFVLLLLLLTAGYTYVALYQPYQGFPSGGVYVDIPHGAPQRTIARLLAENGVVRSRIAFEALCRSRKRSTPEAGEYFFDHPATSFEVFDTLANGRVFVKELVVPEGFTMFDIADLASNEGFLSREDFLAAARDPSLILDLAPHAPSLEGFLFPATYEFPRHVAGKDMTAAMVKRFKQIWIALPPTDAPAAHHTVQDVVTLASLVERETPRAEERPHVAGVFTNRLRIRQPLQCDPTVAYALMLAGKYTGKLNSKDLRLASPYNTYHNRGLPPGPIANPGEASLQAAAAPSSTHDLYFVANTEGGHFFSTTLREHNRNVARYRRLLQQPLSQAVSSAPSATTVSKTSPARSR
jgi:UPF0755 protein